MKRPTPRLVRVELAALGAALVLIVAGAGHADYWNQALFWTLLAVALISDLTAIDTASDRVKLSSSFLAIVTAIVFLGPSPAAIIAIASIFGGWLRRRYEGHFLLINLVTYAWFPLLAGWAFRAAVDGTGALQGEALFFVLVFGLFVLALALDFVLIAGHVSRLESTPFSKQVRGALVPLLPSELASAVLALGIAYVYIHSGVAAVALFAIVLFTFQQLIGALLVSQERQDELKRWAEQLAGFQVGLLSALMRTLDLRDRMTARHSAAVARYAREVARAAGMSEDEQELAHTAGLLHDIGKFVLPDRILKDDRGHPLTEEDWDEIRRHPEEGARIVSEIDGYQPVGEIILAHHERIDGLGYPRGLTGEEIPELSRIISVVDTYDVITARDSYREPTTSGEAIAELRRVAGTQLDPRYVDIFVNMITQTDLGYQHGEEADFEAELNLERRVRDYVKAHQRVVP